MDNKIVFILDVNGVLMENITQRVIKYSTRRLLTGRVSPKTFVSALAHVARHKKLSDAELRAAGAFFESPANNRVRFLHGAINIAKQLNDAYRVYVCSAQSMSKDIDDKTAARINRETGIPTENIGFVKPFTTKKGFFEWVYSENLGAKIIVVDDGKRNIYDALKLKLETRFIGVDYKNLADAVANELQNVRGA